MCTFWSLKAIQKWPRGVQTSSPLNKWSEATNKARKELKITGFCAVGGSSAQGNALYAKVKSILAGRHFKSRDSGAVEVKFWPTFGQHFGQNSANICISNREILGLWRSKFGSTFARHGKRKQVQVSCLFNEELSFPK